MRVKGPQDFFWSATVKYTHLMSRHSSLEKQDRKKLLFYKYLTEIEELRKEDQVTKAGLESN